MKKGNLDPNRGRAAVEMNETKELSELQRMAKDPWVVGLNAWKEAEEATACRETKALWASGRTPPVGELLERSLLRLHCADIHIRFRHGCS